MKRIWIAFVLLIATAVFSSCQKEFAFSDSPSNLPSASPSGSTLDKVKTYTEDLTASGEHTVMTYDLAYDEKGRVTSMTSVSTAGDKFVYDYSTDNSFSLDIYNSSKVSIHVVYFLNSLSLVDSSFQYNDNKDTSTEKYLYNARQLDKLEQFEYVTDAGQVLADVHSYSYDLYGNMLQDSTSNSVKSYEYYDNLVDNLSMGVSFFRKNKNLVKRTTYTEGGSSETSDHTYTFDSLNRITSEKEVLSTGDVVIRRYTY